MNFIRIPIFSIILTIIFSNSLLADCSYELFTVSSSKNTKIIDFIDQLSDQCEFSIIVTDQDAQKVLSKKLNKTHLKNLTIDEVLAIILNENNLSYTLQNNILKISYLTTHTFNIDYVISQRASSGSTNVTLSSQSTQNSTSSTATSQSGTNNSGASSQSGIEITNTDEVQFWNDLDTEFQSVLNRPEDSYMAQKPIINKNAGLVTVTATNNQMNRFKKYIKQLQSRVQSQVLIDVQLLSVTMANSKTTGIDWKQLYALTNVKLSAQNVKTNNVSTWENGTSGNTFNTIDNIGKKAASLISFQAGGSLNEVIKFLQTQGHVNSISNPKVLTLNNQPALITAGTEYFYKLTNTQTLSGTSTSQSANENVQSVFAGVLLSITPQISNDDTITLIINPSLSETSSDISQTTNTDRVMPPDLNRRQLSSVVTVKDGHRIILGGLINTKNTKEANKVPILGDIPIISNLFRYEENIKTVQELVIIIKPHIIKKESNSISLSDLGYTGLNAQALSKAKK